MARFQYRISQYDNSPLDVSPRSDSTMYSSRQSSEQMMTSHSEYSLPTDAGGSPYRQDIAAQDGMDSDRQVSPDADLHSSSYTWQDIVDYYDAVIDGEQHVTTDRGSPYRRTPTPDSDVYIVGRVFFDGGPQDLEGQSHTFKTKTFKRPRNCTLCKQLIWNQGSACRVCKYVCHKKCEAKVMTACVPPVNYELPSNEALARSSDSTSTQAPPAQGIMSSLRTKMSKGREPTSLDMDLTYITERIIALSFPYHGHEAAYRNNLREVAQMLKSKHGDNYTIINLSEKRSDMQKLNPLKVLEFGWPDHLAPPVDRLCNICKCIESWLNSDSRNVVVIHCKGGRGRTGVVIAAYMRYNNICASADQDLDRFAMKKFYDDKLGGVTQPSQRRYVHYFGGFLSGAIKINSSPLFLHHMVMHGVPNFDGQGGCRPYIKVYQAMSPIFISGVYTATSNMTEISIALDPCLQLRGDILIKCYHKRFRSTTREIIFRCQFHTCAISDNRLVFDKSDLDEACNDPRFPNHGRIEFVFSQAEEKILRYDLVRSHSQPVEAAVEPLERWDSYENFNNIVEDYSFEDSIDSETLGRESRVRVMHVQHTEGPLDGNLYATVNKTPRQSTPKQTSVTSQSMANGGATVLHNGPLNQSADSGISSTAGYFGSSQVASQSFHSNTATMTSTTVPSKTTTSENNNTLAQQNQLDELLNDLLSDKMFQSPSGTLERTKQKGLVIPSEGSITTQSGNSRTVVSWQTSQAGPSKNVVVTKETISQPAANKRVESVIKCAEEVSYGKTGQMVNGSLSHDELDRSFGPSVHERSLESRASTLTREHLASPPMPPPRDLTKSPLFRERMVSPPYRDHVTSPPPFGSPTPPPRHHHQHHQLPYGVDYENRDAYADSYGVSQYRGYASDSEEPLSWLERQQAKLQAKREGRSWRKRSEQERQLVSELRTAQSHLMSRRARSESDEATGCARQNPYYAEPQFERRHLSPEPLRKAMTPDPVRRSHSVQGDSYKTEKSYFVSGVERPPFTTHQTKYTFSVSPPMPAANGESVRAKPPPSPNLGRSSAPNSPIIPQRGASSREAVARTRTVTREYTETGQTRLLRQLSDSSFERSMPWFGRHSPDPWSANAYTPPVRKPSPAPPEDDIKLVPIGPFHTVTPEPKQQTLPHSHTLSSIPNSSRSGEQVFVTEEPSPVNSVIESFITKQTVSAKTSAGYSPKLDELERNLQAVLQAPTSQAPINSGYDSEEFVSRRAATATYATESSFETRQAYNTYERKQEQRKPAPPPPAPEEEEVVEQEVISLKPIGVHALEPETTPSTLPRSTTPRSTTPSFPVQVVTTPPFPTSPKTPYENKGTTSPLASATLPAKPTSPPPQQHVQHAATISRHQTQQYSQQHVQQFATQAAPVNGPSAAPTQIQPADNRVQSPVPRQPVAQPPAYSTLQREQQQSPGGGTLAGNQQTFSQHSMQKSYTTQQVPVVDGVHTQAHGLQQTEQYSQHSVQYGQQALVQPGTLQHGTVTPQAEVQRGIVQGSVQQGVVQQGAAQHGMVQHQGTVQHGMVPHQGTVQHGTVPQQGAVQHGMVQHGMTQQTVVQHGMTQQAAVQHGTTASPQPQIRGLGQEAQQTSQFSTQQQHQQVIQQQVLQQQQQQQQQSMSRHMQYSQQGVVQNDNLSVDTSQRVAAGTLPRSPSAAASFQSPPSPGSVQTLRTQLSQSGSFTPGAQSATGQSSPSVYFGQSRRASLSSLAEGADVVHHTPRFVRDTSKFWYKPHISREEAINMLKNKPPGTFVVRDSNSFPGAFGLALKVSQVPPNVQTKGADPQAELVRHFLIEPTPKGVKLKGCSNEPVFGSLAALVYQHSITPLALPCKLVLPESDPAGTDVTDGKKEHVSSSSIMQQGAACNVLYINSVDMESLTGREAVAKAVNDSIGTEPAKCTVVHFKVSSQGITLTDNKRKLFFRRHYPINTVTYCGLDPEDRRWSKKYEDQPIPQNARLFGFVARKQGSATDNACHIFAELDPDQPAHAIVSFVSKVMAGQGHFMKS